MVIGNQIRWIVCVCVSISIKCSYAIHLPFLAIDSNTEQRIITNEIKREKQKLSSLSSNAAFNGIV